MVLEFILNIVIAFVIVISGSYVGAKMALNTFFGRDFDGSESGSLGSSDSASDAGKE